MRLQCRLRQIAADLTDRDGRHDPAVDNFIGQFAMSPAIDRASRLLGRLTSHGQNLSYLFSGELPRGTATWGITEDVFNGAAQCGLAFMALDGHQGIEGLLPALSPEADLFSPQSDFIGDRYIEHASESH